MAEEIDYKKVIDDISLIIEKLPEIQRAHGINIPSYLPIVNYPHSKQGLEQLKTDFNEIDFSLVMDQNNLKREVDHLKKEKKSLEKSYATLSSLIGEDGTAGEGTVFHGLVTNLRGEISGLLEQRDKLDAQVSEKERRLNEKIAAIDSKVIAAEAEAKEKISNAEEHAKVIVETTTIKARQKVKLIEQFSDFLSETNDNMKLYTRVIIALIIIAAGAVYFSIPDLLSCFKSYDGFIKSLGAKATTWQILNLAFGLLIVKLPWALVLSAIFTGLYRLLKGLLFTYEKINQDKRNMSAIYAVTGNVAQSLNDYGFAIIDTNIDLENDDREIITFEVSRSQLSQKRESLKWNQIMNYFEKMETHKAEPDKEEGDKRKFESLINLVGKALDKVPVIK